MTAPTEAPPCANHRKTHSLVTSLVELFDLYATSSDSYFCTCIDNYESVTFIDGYLDIGLLPKDGSVDVQGIDTRD